MNTGRLATLFGVGLMALVLTLVLSTGEVYARGGRQVQGAAQMQPGTGAGLAAMPACPADPAAMGAQHRGTQMGQGRMAAGGGGMMRHGAAALDSENADADAACACAQTGQAGRHGTGDPEQCPLHAECPNAAECPLHE